MAKYSYIQQTPTKLYRHYDCKTILSYSNTEKYGGVIYLLCGVYGIGYTCKANNGTHRKFNIAPENRWLEDYLPFWRVTFQGLCLNLGGVNT